MFLVHGPNESAVCAFVSLSLSNKHTKRYDSATTPPPQCRNVRVGIAPTTLVLVDECGALALFRPTRVGPGGLAGPTMAGDLCLDLTEDPNENISETEAALLSFHFGRARDRFCG